MIIYGIIHVSPFLQSGVTKIIPRKITENVVTDMPVTAVTVTIEINQSRRRTNKSVVNGDEKERTN